MIPTTDNSVIYVLCPSHIVTGGIEAVHQLVDKLRKFGHNANIVPLPQVRNPALLQYRNYEVEFASHIEDDPRNLLITTEVNPRQLDHYSSIRKALWWLSVDNHEKLAEGFEFDDPKNKSVVHFVQSAFAHNFLSQKGVETIYPLTDYLHAEYFRNIRPQKHNRVLYTPIKGADAYVDRLIRADPSIEWRPLKGLIRKAHAQALREGKVYVDFGSHPGKDRQPREAAVNGCCVIVGLKGSAACPEDMSIPDRYKFPLEPLDGTAILSTLRACLAEHGERRHDFDAYVDGVIQEERRFEQEILSIFGGTPRRTRRSPRAIALRNTWLFVRQNKAPTILRGLANEFLPLAITNGIRRRYRAMVGTSIS